MPIRFALALSLLAGVALADPQLREVSRFELTHSNPQFGGLSGLELDESGSVGWAINDRAHVFPIRLLRGPDGNLLAVELGESRRLRMPPSDRVIDAKGDTEGLVIAPGGRVYVSLESPSRIWNVSEDWRVLFSTGFGDDLNALLETTGIEALALDRTGRLIAIPEWPIRPRDTTFPILRQTKGTPGWEIAAHIPRRGSFKPVGADFGDDGLLYLLERNVSMLGFRSRIRRFDLESDGLREEVLLTTQLGQYDNLEAITLWRDQAARLRVVLMSDDNLWKFQRTELIEFVLTE